MNKLVRGALYFFVVFLFVYGATGLLAPQVISGQVFLSPVTIAGTAELRGLYGGGFIGFGFVILCGLRCKSLAPGLLMAMAIIMSCVVVGRVVSLAIDNEFAFTLPAIVGEVLLVLACWAGSRNAAGEAKQ